MFDFVHTKKSRAIRNFWRISASASAYFVAAFPLMTVGTMDAKAQYAHPDFEKTQFKPRNNFQPGYWHILGEDSDPTRLSHKALREYEKEKHVTLCTMYDEIPAPEDPKGYKVIWRSNMLSCPDKGYVNGTDDLSRGFMDSKILKGDFWSYYIKPTDEDIEREKELRVTQAQIVEQSNAVSIDVAERIKPDAVADEKILALTAQALTKPVVSVMSAVDAYKRPDYWGPQFDQVKKLGIIMHERDGVEYARVIVDEEMYDRPTGKVHGVQQPFAENVTYLASLSNGAGERFDPVLDRVLNERVKAEIRNQIVLKNIPAPEDVPPVVTMGYPDVPAETTDLPAFEDNKTAEPALAAPVAQDMDALPPVTIKAEEPPVVTKGDFGIQERPEAVEQQVPAPTVERTPAKAQPDPLKGVKLFDVAAMPIFADLKWPEPAPITRYIGMSGAPAIHAAVADDPKEPVAVSSAQVLSPLAVVTDTPKADDPVKAEPKAAAAAKKPEPVETKVDTPAATVVTPVPEMVTTEADPDQNEPLPLAPGSISFNGIHAIAERFERTSVGYKSSQVYAKITLENGTRIDVAQGWTKPDRSNVAYIVTQKNGQPWYEEYKLGALEGLATEALKAIADVKSIDTKFEPKSDVKAVETSAKEDAKAPEEKDLPKEVTIKSTVWSISETYRLPEDGTIPQSMIVMKSGDTERQIANGWMRADKANVAFTRHVGKDGKVNYNAFYYKNEPEFKDEAVRLAAQSTAINGQKPSDTVKNSRDENLCQKFTSIARVKQKIADADDTYKDYVRVTTKDGRVVLIENQYAFSGALRAHNVIGQNSAGLDITKEFDLATDNLFAPLVRKMAATAAERRATKEALAAAKYCSSTSPK